MKAEFIICANSETICDGYTSEHLDCWREEIARAYVGAAARVILDAGCDYQLSTNFADWNGGRYSCYQQRTRGYIGGGVICRSDAGELRELRERAEDAADAARDAAIAEYEALELSACAA